MMAPRAMQHPAPEGAPELQWYARIAAIVLLAVATGVLCVWALLAVAAAGSWAWEWRVISVFYHAGTSLLFLYVGFLLEDTTIVRRSVDGPGECW